ncbi:MAG: hypothetical protein ACJ75H_17100 [Thermoanaerobaculia bacterium]
MKRLILAGLVALGAWGITLIPSPASANDPCAGVRCMECPAGFHLDPKPNDCCRCVAN